MNKDRPRLAAAMLRVVLELRREPDADLEELIARVIDETGIDAAELRRFITSHGEVMARVAGRRRGG